MSEGVFTGFWRETNKKVLKRQKTRVQGWFMRHPITFGVSWGVTAGAKGLFWSLPRWGWRKWTGRPAKPKKTTAATSNSNVTVVETEIVDSEGNVTTATTTTTKTGPEPFVMHPPQQVGAATSTDTSRPTLVLVDPIERNHIMEAGRELLTRTPLGHGFAGLASEFDHFTPVRGNEAQSTVDMLGDAYLGLRRISMAVETFSDIIGDCGLHRTVVTKLYLAAESADALKRAMDRANTAVGNLYEGQIDQDQSGATSVQAGLVAVGVGDEAEGIGPFSSIIAGCYENFSPEPDQEATQILAYITASQAGFALLNDALVKLSPRLRRHGVDNRVRRLIRAAAGDALNAATVFQDARQTMSRLYRGQIGQEGSGVTTIRSAPLRHAS